MSLDLLNALDLAVRNIPNKITRLNLLVSTLNLEQSPYRCKPLTGFHRLSLLAPIASNQARINRIIDFLARYSVICIGVEDILGRGHQSASYLLIDILRDRFNYKGSIEIICNESEKNNSKANLVSLDQTNLTVLLPHETESRGVRVIGMSGASDRLDLMRRDLNQCLYILQLQPLQWESKKEIYIYPEDRAEKLQLPDTAAYQYTVPDIDQLEFSLRRFLALTSSPNHDRRRNQLITLANQFKVGCLEALMLYGQSIEADEIIKTMLAIKYAQENSLENQRPVVLMLCNTLNSENLISLKKRLGAEGLQFVELGTEEANEIIMTKSKLMKKHILCYCGRLPQKVFQLFVRLSSWPAITEGANTINLLRLLQKPYINTLPISFTKYPSRFGKGVKDREKRDCKRITKAWESPNPIPLGLFFIATRSRDSAKTQYFHGIGRQNLNPYSDQVAIGLDELRRISMSIKKVKKG